ncbi:MAG TPA: rhomboid family intramembrane serine protease, partial [Fimbriimonadaceae bacterium]|nr:rhomboid family intramembrane serine protease [Fimbriimonadaceae bacterium]
ALVGYYSVRYFNLRVPIAPNMGVPVAAMAILWAVLQMAGAVWTLGAPSMGGSAYWAHLGGLAVGLLLSVVFGAPKLADLELGHEALDRMNHRSPAARLSTAEHVLAKHPKDLRALREKAESYALLGEPEAEAAAWIELLDQTPELEQVPILERLSVIGHLGRLPSIRRSLLADRFKSSESNLSTTLLKSIVSVPQDPQRPDALLALHALDQNPNWIEVLLREYPLHPATELARQRGLCP